MADGLDDTEETLAAGFGLLVVNWSRLSEARRADVLRVLVESLHALEAPVPGWIVALYRTRLNTNN